MNRERIVSLLLALLMVISMIPFSAFAESEVTDEEAAPFEETIEISEDHPEAEIIVEDAEPDDLTVEATEEPTEDDSSEEIIDYTITVVNKPNEVMVKKIDQDGNALAGATFALCDVFGNRTATAVSDQDGIVRFERIPYGEYTIREIIAPSDYLLSKDVINLTVDADYRNTGEPIATVVNRLKNLPFIKQNTAGQPMAGVSFSLLNAINGDVMETVTSNSKGEFAFKSFDYGLWLVHENKAPDGYNLMPDYSVSVDGNWTEPAAVILTNIPDHYEFLKTDNEGNPLAGVKFMLEDAEGNALQELISGEDGMVHVTGVVPGSYVIRETETLEGFTVSDDPIEITIDDSYVVADEIPVFVNYPVIQTGVDFEITPPMMAGAALIGTGGIGSVVMLLKRKKKHGKA